MKIYFSMGLFTLLIGSFFGCDNTSSLSEKPVTDPSLLQVHIDIELNEEIYRSTYETIKVELTDKKLAPVNNPGLQVKVNNIVMPFRLATGNYYDKYPYYQFWNDSLMQVRGSTAYAFTVVLSDSTAYPAGSITTQKKMTADKFSFPDTHQPGKDLVLAWKEVQEAGVLKVIRHTEETDSTGNKVLMGGSSNDPETMIKEISSGWLGLFGNTSGTWTIPASYFHIPNGRVTDLTFEWVSEKEAVVDGNFAKGSYIKSTFRLSKYIPLEEAISK